MSVKLEISLGEAIDKLTILDIKRGKISKTNCIICNSPDVEAHHHDYAKPLEVVWFCRKCHIEHHEKG